MAEQHGHTCGICFRVSVSDGALRNHLTCSHRVARAAMRRRTVGDGELEDLGLFRCDFCLVLGELEYMDAHIFYCTRTRTAGGDGGEATATELGGATDLSSSSGPRPRAGGLSEEEAMDTDGGGGGMIDHGLGRGGGDGEDGGGGEDGAGGGMMDRGPWGDGASDGGDGADGGVDDEDFFLEDGAVSASAGLGAPARNRATGAAHENHIAVGGKLMSPLPVGSQASLERKGLQARARDEKNYHLFVIGRLDPSGGGKLGAASMYHCAGCYCDQETYGTLQDAEARGLANSVVEVDFHDLLKCSWVVGPIDFERRQRRTQDACAYCQRSLDRNAADMGDKPCFCEASVAVSLTKAFGCDVWLCLACYSENCVEYRTPWVPFAPVKNQTSDDDVANEDPEDPDHDNTAVKTSEVWFCDGCACRLENPYRAGEHGKHDYDFSNVTVADVYGIDTYQAYPPGGAIPPCTPVTLGDPVDPRPRDVAAEVTQAAAELEAAQLQQAQRLGREGGAPVVRVAERLRVEADKHSISDAQLEAMLQAMNDFHDDPAIDIHLGSPSLLPRTARTVKSRTAHATTSARTTIGIERRTLDVSLLGQPETTVEVVRLDAMAQIEQLLRDPRVAGHLYDAKPPECFFDESGTQLRGPESFHSPAYRRVWDHAEPGVMPLVLQVWADKVLMGARRASTFHPVRLYLLNLSAEVRFQPWASILVGFIPVPKFARNTGRDSAVGDGRQDSTQATILNQIYHDSIAWVLAGLNRAAEAMSYHHVNGHRRLCRVVLLQLVMDLIEQYALTNILQYQCTKCLLQSNISLPVPDTVVKKKKAPRKSKLDHVFVRTMVQQEPYRLNEGGSEGACPHSEAHGARTTAVQLGFQKWAMLLRRAGTAEDARKSFAHVGGRDFREEIQIYRLTALIPPALGGLHRLLMPEELHSIRLGVFQKTTEMTFSLIEQKFKRTKTLRTTGDCRYEIDYRLRRVPPMTDGNRRLNTFGKSGAFWEVGMHTADDWESLEMQVPFLIIGATRLIPNAQDRAVVVDTHLQLLAVYEKLKAWSWEQLPAFEEGLKADFHKLVGLFRAFQKLVVLEASEGLNVIKSHELLGFLQAVLHHGPIMNYSASAGEMSNKGLKEAYQHSDIRGTHSDVAAVLLERDVALRAAKDGASSSGTQARLAGHVPQPLSDLSLAQYCWADLHNGVSGPALEAASDELIRAVNFLIQPEDRPLYSILTQALVPLGNDTASIFRPGMCVEIAPDDASDPPSVVQILAPLKSGSGMDLTIDFVCLRFFSVDPTSPSHPEAPGIHFLYRGRVSCDVGLYSTACVRHRAHIIPYFGDDDPLAGAGLSASDSDGEEDGDREYFLRNPFMWRSHPAPCEAGAEAPARRLVYCPCPESACPGRAARPQEPALGFQRAQCGVCGRVVVF